MLKNHRTRADDIVSVRGGIVKKRGIAVGIASKYGTEYDAGIEPTCEEWFVLYIAGVARHQSSG
jgi:hypothetical protein